MGSFNIPSLTGAQDTNHEQAHEPANSSPHSTSENHLGSNPNAEVLNMGTNGSVSNGIATVGPYHAHRLPNSKSGHIHTTLHAEATNAPEIPPAAIPQAKQPAARICAGFLIDFPEYVYTIPDGPRLQFTMVDITAIMMNWFKNQFLITRFLNNGFNSSVHMAILQEHRDITLSEVELNRAKDSLSDQYSKSMRQIDKDWKKAIHKTPAEWDGNNTVINNFLSDVTHMPDYQKPEPIPFKQLWNGMKKLPHGPDAGDLTRALEFAQQNVKTGPNGESEEFMFPDDIHMILNHIGHTTITPDHSDSAIIARYKQALQKADAKIRKRRREAEEAGEGARLPSRGRSEAEAKAKTPKIKITRQVPATLDKVLFPREEMSETQEPQTPQKHQAANSPIMLSYGAKHPMTPVSNFSNQNSPKMASFPRPSAGNAGWMSMDIHAPSPSSNIRPFTHTECFSQVPGRYFKPYDREVDLGFSKDSEMATAQVVSDNTGPFPLSDRFKDGSSVIFEPLNEKDAFTPSEELDSGSIAPQHVETQDFGNNAQAGQLASDDIPSVSYTYNIPHYDANQAGATIDHQEFQGASAEEFFGVSMVEMDAFLQHHKDFDYAGLIYPQPEFDISFANEASSCDEIEQINAWPQYPSTQMLRDCIEADDPNDHSDLARTARWCRNPTNNAEGYLIGHAWLVLALEQMLGDVERYEQGRLCVECED